MTPHEALDMMYGVVKQLRLTMDEHTKMAQAYGTLHMALKPKADSLPTGSSVDAPKDEKG